MTDFLIPVNFEDIPDGFGVVPEGDYTFKIVDCEQRAPAEGSKSKNQRLFLGLRVVTDGEFKGTSVPFGITLVEESAWMFKRLMAAIVPPDTYAKLAGKKFNTENFIGKEFDAHATQRSYTNPETQKKTISNDLSMISRAGTLTSGKATATETATTGKAPAQSW